MEIRRMSLSKWSGLVGYTGCDRNYSGILIGLLIAILYFLARKITAEGAEER